MDELFRPRPSGWAGAPDPIAQTDPLLERQWERSPWELQAARWRAWALAELAFEGPVRTSVGGGRGSHGFRGLLTLRVPFRGIDEHRSRERVFLCWVASDPVLARVPLVFVFEPEPVGAV